MDGNALIQRTKKMLNNSEQFTSNRFPRDVTSPVPYQRIVRIEPQSTSTSSASAAGTDENDSAADEGRPEDDDKSQ